jgi:hypothetical protein
MKRYFILPLCFFIIACNNTDIKDLAINKDNKDAIIEKVKKSKDLTGEEVGLFYGALARTAVSDKQLSEGKTIQDLINEQRKIVEDNKAKEAEAKRLAEEAKLKEMKIAKELSDYIVVVPIKKGVKKASYENYIFEESVIENKGEKDIRAFRGETIYNDLFGEHVYTVGIYYDKGLKSKEKKRYVGYIKYNQFNEHQTKFALTELDNMKFEWKPTGIIFKDGSKLGIE